VEDRVQERDIDNHQQEEQGKDNRLVQAGIAKKPQFQHGLVFGTGTVGPEQFGQDQGDEGIGPGAISRLSIGVAIKGQSDVESRKHSGKDRDALGRDCENHVLVEDRFILAARRLLHDIGFTLFLAQGQSWEAVRDQVEPEQLDWQERDIERTQDQGAQEDDQDLAHIAGQGRICGCCCR